MLTGLDAVAQNQREAAAAIRGRRIGLLAHAPSVTREFESAQSVLQRAGASVQALFGPEHGFHGSAQDMISVGSTRERKLPLYSLYGTTKESLAPQKEWLAGLDAVVVDLQDIGSRYYTYVWTAAMMLLAASKAGVQVVVLDRPNPLGGTKLEGPLQQSDCLSFVGLYSVPVRHGMTVGEILRMVAVKEKLPEGALSVVPVQGWCRDDRWCDAAYPWVMPSPNMPAFETARVYPGGCLLEATNLSEARGTTRPFELWGAPWLTTADKPLAALKGAHLREVVFVPMFHKYAHEACTGVQVHLSADDDFRAFEAYALWIHQVRDAHPERFCWRRDTYEFEAERQAIDLLTGSADFRTRLQTLGDVRDWLRTADQSIQRFDEERQAWLLPEYS